MKTRTPLALIAAGFALSPLWALADDTPASSPPPAAAAPAVAPAAPAAGSSDEKKTDLDLRMDRVSKAFRKLRKQVSDPTQNASSLALLATMQAALAEAVDLTPEKAADVPADKKDKFMADYKAGIKGMQDEFTKLGDALTAGKNDDAAKIVADIFALEKKDHKDFRRPDDK
jgi:soluble cytochrome b562